MQSDEHARMAVQADAEDLWRLIRDSHPAVLMSSLRNPHFNEDMASLLARSPHATPELLGALSADVRFRNNYPLKVALCKNPRTPQKIVYSLLKFLKIFDLADISRSLRLPIAVRQRVEFLLGERIGSMPSGVRTALAKRAGLSIVLQILAKGDTRSVASCLRSPVMTEGGLRQIISRKSTKPEVVRAIAEDAKWSLRYDLKYALLRNEATPRSQAARFARELKLSDLRDLCRDPEVSDETRDLLCAELSGRGESADEALHEIYHLDDQDDDALMEYHENRGEL